MRAGPCKKHIYHLKHTSCMMTTCARIHANQTHAPMRPFSTSITSSCGMLLSCAQLSNIHIAQFNVSAEEARLTIQEQMFALSVTQVQD